MSDNKYTAKEREFIRLHELQHTLIRLEREIAQQVGPRCTEHAWILNYKTCVVCKTWEALDDLKGVLLSRGDTAYANMNEAIDFVINKELETDKAYANMTTQEIFQVEGGITRPIAERGKPMPDQSHLYIDCTTTEDNDDE